MALLEHFSILQANTPVASSLSSKTKIMIVKVKKSKNLREQHKIVSLEITDNDSNGTKCTVHDTTSVIIFKG